MLLKSAILSVLLISAVPGLAEKQREAPLFLDVRPGEDPSVIDVTEITQQYDKNAVEEYEEGLAEARKGDREASEKHLREAIRIAPDFFNAHNSLAILLHQTLRYPEAEVEYEEARRLNPRSAAPFVNLASLHIDEALQKAKDDPRAARGIFNDALADLNQAFELQPRSALASYLTGVVYYFTGFLEESESHLKDALDSGGDRLAFAHIALADVYIRMKEWDNVVAQLDTFLAERPFDRERTLIRSVRDAAARKSEFPGQ
jgi:Flp pilus assembly protein TadD